MSNCSHRSVESIRGAEHWRCIDCSESFMPNSKVDALRNRLAEAEFSAQQARNHLAQIQARLEQVTGVDTDSMSNIEALAARAACFPAMIRALKAQRMMLDRGSEPRKFDEFLSWRDNDLLARRMVDEAIAQAEAAGGGKS